MILQEIQDRLAQKIRAWAKSQKIPEPQDIPFAPPPAHVEADLSCAWPLQAAKLLGRKPLDVARELAQALGDAPGAPSATAPPEVLPPGFLNFRLTSDSLSRNLTAILSNPNAYGTAQASTKRRKILIEFVSANPTGPLHLASGRAATLGDSLARILRRIGHEVAKEYYVNDAGGRVELLGLSIRARYEQLRGKESPVPEKGYHGEYLKELAAQAPAEASGWAADAFGRYAMGRLLASHKADMEAFGVSFDRWFLESELYASRAVEKTLGHLRECGMVYEKEGATWLGTR
ncbi:MAG: arginine--tRNA ligase, partial [Elusimicrobia bacterium]|nr:arginine--tRNA ligase [Elusimicrobiota bacterium]